MRTFPKCLLIFTAGFLACTPKTDIAPVDHTGTHLEYFGFTIVDTYWDDPTDAEVKSNYADEIHGFSNLADILVLQPTDNIASRVQTFNNFAMKAILHLNEIFFEVADTNSSSGTNYDLRTDYQNRWDQFVAANGSVLNEDLIGAYYIGEEPTWNGIRFEELAQVCNLVKDQFPGIPIMIIEAYPVLNDLQVPETADWIGFDHYFIKNPNTDPVFQQEWEVLKSKLSSPLQRIMIIMDSHYIDWAHRDFGGIKLNEMDEVAANYHRLAKSDTSVIGMLGYFWPNGFDIPRSIGARGMPEAVKMEYERIGKAITGKE